MPGEVDSNELMRMLASGEYNKGDVNSYLSRLVVDLSRSKTKMRRELGEVKGEMDSVLEERDRLKDENLNMTSELDAYARAMAELDSKVKEYEEKFREMDDLLKDKENEDDERSGLMGRINEVEDQNSQLRNELDDLTRIKEQLLSELEKARLDNNKPLEKEPDTDDEEETFTADTDEPNTSYDHVDQQADTDSSRDEEDVVTEPFYSTELMTSSGFDLLNMLRGARSDGMDDGSAIQVSKTWEEESEEITADPNRENGQIVKKIRKKMEVSVKYTNAE